MPYSVRKITRTVQPQTPVELDSSNPFARGLKHFWYVPVGRQMLEAARGSHGAFGTANTIQAIPSGVAAIMGTGDPTSTINVTGCDPDDYGNFTVFARIYAPNLYSRTQFVMGSAYNGGLAFLVDGSGYLQLGQSYQVMAAVSSLAIPTGEFADVMASWDGTTTRYWVNGVNAGTDTTAIAISAKASLQLLGQEDGLCFASGSMLQYAGIYDRAIISDAEALAIARNPWQLLEPIRRSLFIPAASATVFYKTISGSLSFVGAAGKSISKTSSGALTFSGTLVIGTIKIVSGAINFFGTLNKLIGLARGGTLSVMGALGQIRTKLIALTGSLSFSGAASRQTQKALSGAANFSGGFSKAISKGLAGSLSFTGILAASRLIMVAVAGAISFTGTVSRGTLKSVAGVLTFVGGLSRRISIFKAGSIGFSGLVGKAIYKQVVGVLSLSGVVSAVLNLINAIIARLIFTQAKRSMIFTQAKRSITFKRIP